MKTRLLLLPAFLPLLATTAWALDLPYGSDGIPYLAAHASRIVHVHEPGGLSVPQDAEAELFLVRVRAVIRGASPGTDRLTLAIPRSLAIASASELEDAVVFLAEPLGQEEAAKLGLAAGTKVHPVVSGRHGVLPGKNLVMVREYLDAADPGRFTWAEKHLTAGDRTIARSALLVVEQAALKKDSRASKLLAQCLESTTLAAEWKVFALECLQASAGSGAFSVLSTLVKDVARKPTLRVAAVQALGYTAEGVTFLKSVEKGGDQTVAPAAARVLAEVEERESNQADSLTPERRQALIARLTSKATRDRLAAARECGRYAPSKEIVRALRDSALGAAEGSLNVKLAAIKSLARLATDEAQEALADIVENEGEDDFLRESAVQSLDRAPQSVKDRMQKLHEQAKNPFLRRWALRVAQRGTGAATPGGSPGAK